MLYNLANYITEAKKLGIFVRFPDADNVDIYEEKFEHLIKWDVRRNHDPLIVYEHKNKPVAFYDVTTLEGFIFNSVVAASSQEN